MYKALGLFLILSAASAGQTVSSIPAATGGGGGGAVASVTGDGFKTSVSPTTGATVVSLTSEMCGRSEACTILAAWDFSGAGQFIAVRGAGAPSGTACDSAGEIASLYVNTSAGASADSLYLCEPNGGSPAWRLMPRSGGGGTFATTDLGWWIAGPIAGAGSVQAINALTQFKPRYFSYRALATETVRQVSMYAASGAAGNVRVGIYDSSCNLLVQSASVAMTAGTAATATFSPAQTMTPGYYYFALISDHATGGVVGGVGGSTADAVIINAGVTTPVVFDGATGGSITLPGACGSRTSLTGFATHIPAMWGRP